MYFTKKVLAALLLAPSALVSAEVGLQSFICGPNTGGLPALRTHHWRGNQDYDDFKVCVRPVDSEITYYKVVALTPQTCDNPSGSLPMSEVNVVGDVDGARGWNGQRGSTDSMGFTGTINESLVSGTDFDFKCKGAATVQYIGPKAVQTYQLSLPSVQDQDVYAGFCVTNGGSVTSVTSSGYSWGTIDNFQAGTPMFTNSQELWPGAAGPCRGKPLKIPSSMLGEATTINVSTLAGNRRNGVKMCVVTNPSQNTAVEPYLRNNGFGAEGPSFGQYQTYCKMLRELITEVELEETTFTSIIELDTKVTMRLHI